MMKTRWAYGIYATLGVALLLIAGLVGRSTAAHPTKPVSTTALAAATTTSLDSTTSTLPETATIMAHGSVVVLQGNKIRYDTGPNRDPNYRYGESYNQGTPANCAYWLIQVENDSNLEVTSITFTPSSSEYSTTVSTYQTWNATPKPATQETSIAPGATQDVAFQSCTSTPVPNGGNASYETAFPNKLYWKWSNGQAGSGPF